MTRKSILHSKIFLLFFVLMMLIPLIALIPTFLNNSIHFNSDDPMTSNSTPHFNSSALPQIDYESLNKSWYNQDIEMLIIVPDGNQDFVNAVKPLAEWKNQKGVKTIILSNYTDYNGSDGPEQIRNMIKSYYLSEGIRWVVLAGDAESGGIPIRNVYDELNNEQPTDYYYADLNGTWDSDGDKTYGEPASENNNKAVDEIDWTPEVYVGRLPASTTAELSNMVDKILKYEQNPTVGNWMNDMLLAGGVADWDADFDGARLTSYIIENYLDQINSTHLCATTDAYDPPGIEGEDWYFLDHSSFREDLNNGHSTILFVGHGNPTYFADKYGGYDREIYNLNDVSNCNNENKPSLIYADACTTSPYDSTDDNLGEALIKKIDRGAIGYVGALEITFYSGNNLDMLNRGNAKLFWKIFFEDHTYQQGKTLYDSKIAYMNSDYYKYESPSDFEPYERRQLLTYNLLGDPEVDVYTNVSGKISNNPFPSEVYEGQMIELDLMDNYSREIVKPRVYLYNDERGIGRTVYGDEKGNVKFRLPLGEGITYNVSISGHNLAGLSNFSFTTLPDNETPTINDVDLSATPTFFGTNLDFAINTTDDASGIESVFVLFSTNNFESFTYHQVRNRFDENRCNFDFKVSTLNEGTYQYLVCTRDYANKTDILYQTNFQVNIPIPIGFYVVLGSGIGLISASMIATVYYVRKAPTDLDESLEPE